MSQGGYFHVTRASGTVLTAAIYNSDHQNHITNQNPSMTGGYSDDVTEMQKVWNPGTLGGEDLATSLAGEIERLRYQIRAILGEAQWYIAPTMNLKGLSGGGVIPPSALQTAAQGSIITRVGTGTGPVNYTTIPALTALAPVSGDLLLGVPAAGGALRKIDIATISPQASAQGQISLRNSAGAGAMEAVAIPSLTARTATAGDLLLGSLAGGGAPVKIDVATIMALATASVTVGDSPPGSPADNALWWNSLDGNLYIYYYDGNSRQWVAATNTISPISTQQFPQGRLSLAFNTPVMTANVAGSVATYYTPYVGDLVPLFDGTVFKMYTFSEMSQALSDTSKSPAATVANTNYDVFVWTDTATGGTLRATRGPAWSSATVRGAAADLVLVKGIWLNAAAITNGPAIQRGTYVGTIRTNASNTADFILGGSGAEGVNAYINIWNTYNREIVSPTSIYTTNKTGIPGGGWTTVGTSHTINWVRGLDVDMVKAFCSGVLVPGATSDAALSVGSAANTPVGSYGFNGSASQQIGAQGNYNGFMGIGSRQLLFLARVINGANNCNVNGTVGGAHLSADLWY